VSAFSRNIAVGESAQTAHEDFFHASVHV